MAGLYRQLGQQDKADSIGKEVENMKETVLQHGWDGDWFLRAYDFFGEKVGSHECEEGRIFIEPQGFCVMAGAGIEERTFLLPGANFHVILSTLTIPSYCG